MDSASLLRTVPSFPCPSASMDSASQLRTVPSFPCPRPSASSAVPGRFGPVGAVSEACAGRDSGLERRIGDLERRIDQQERRIGVGASVTTNPGGLSIATSVPSPRDASQAARSGESVAPRSGTVAAAARSVAARTVASRACTRNGGRAFVPPQRPSTEAVSSARANSREDSNALSSRVRNGVGNSSTSATRRLRLAPRNGASSAEPSAVGASARPARSSRSPPRPSSSQTAPSSGRARSASQERHESREQRWELGQQIAQDWLEHKQQLQLEKQARLQKNMESMLQQLMGHAPATNNDELAAVVVSIRNTGRVTAGSATCDNAVETGCLDSPGEIPEVGIRRRSRRGPQRGTYVADYQVDVTVLPQLLKAIRENGEDLDSDADEASAERQWSMDADDKVLGDGEDDDELFPQLLTLLVDLEAVDPSCVVFELEGHLDLQLACGSSGVDSQGSSAQPIVQLAAVLVRRGYMVAVSDSALDALIQAWSEPHETLGANPFRRLGVCTGAANVRFDPRLFAISPCSRLRAVGEVCSREGRAQQVAAPSGEVAAYTLAFRSHYPTDQAIAPGELDEEAIIVPYELDVLSIATKLPGIELDHIPEELLCQAVNCHGVAGHVNCLGAAGHVLLRYPATGGALMASPGRWHSVRTVEERLLKAVAQSYGHDVAVAVQQRLSSCGSHAEARAQLVQRLGHQHVQQSAQCQYGRTMNPFLPSDG